MLSKQAYKCFYVFWTTYMKARSTGELGNKFISFHEI